MKKTLLLASVASLFAFQTHAAEIKPYVGLDAGYSHAEYATPGILTGFNENFGVASINIGTKIGEYFGVEVSSTASTASENFGWDLSYTSVGIDALGYIPVSDKVELFASAGLGYYTFDMSQDLYDNISQHYQHSDTAFRVGAGVQYNFNDTWAMRGMVKHAFIDADYIIDSVTEASLGVRYSF